MDAALKRTRRRVEIGCACGQILRQTEPETTQGARPRSRCLAEKLVRGASTPGIPKACFKDLTWRRHTCPRGNAPIYLRGSRWPSSNTPCPHARRADAERAAAGDCSMSDFAPGGRAGPRADRTAIFRAVAGAGSRATQTARDECAFCDGEGPGGSRLLRPSLRAISGHPRAAVVERVELAGKPGWARRRLRRFAPQREGGAIPKRARAEVLTRTLKSPSPNRRARAREKKKSPPLGSSARRCAGVLFPVTCPRAFLLKRQGKVRWPDARSGVGGEHTDFRSPPFSPTSVASGPRRQRAVKSRGSSWKTARPWSPGRQSRGDEAELVGDHQVSSGHARAMVQMGASRGNRCFRMDWRALYHEHR